MEIWGLKTCDTCHKALVALPAARLRDVRADPLTADELADLLTRFGPALVNRASTTWRGLSEEERAEQPATLLAKYPALMKRPVIRDGADWHLGWTPTIRSALGVQGAP